MNGISSIDSRSSSPPPIIQPVPVEYSARRIYRLGVWRYPLATEISRAFLDEEKQLHLFDALNICTEISPVRELKPAKVGLGPSNYLKVTQCMQKSQGA
jgi:hypothetical protein